MPLGEKSILPTCWNDCVVWTHGGLEGLEAVHEVERVVAKVFHSPVEGALGCVAGIDGDDNGSRHDGLKSVEGLWLGWLHQNTVHTQLL